MSFRDNLQHLRTAHNLTQEQLAMLLGVSRQSVTKWESERAYPEMDKLLKLCSIFDCTLDELVQGDLTTRPAAPTVGSHPAIPQDTCGYDEHMRSYAWYIALGVSSIILGVALTALIDVAIGNETLATAAFFAGIIVGLSLIIPAGMAHASFVRAHPYIADFYTPEEKQAANVQLSWGIIGGVACIFLGILCCAFLEEANPHTDAGVSPLIAWIAIAVGCFIYTGIMHSRVNLDAYNNAVAEELSDAEIAALPDAARRERLMAAKRRSKLTGSVCAIIMLVATILGLTMLFVPALHTPFFWLAWVFGGISCGIASIAIEGLRRS